MLMVSYTVHKENPLCLWWQKLLRKSLYKFIRNFKAKKSLGREYEKCK